MMMMEQQWNVVQTFSNNRTLQYVFMFLVGLIMFTYFSVQPDGHHNHHYDFWETRNKLQFQMKDSEQPQWKPEFLGEVNVHVFEDWCGGSVDQLRKDQLFPFFPHFRTTINRLAVHPKWENYGIRIFGYIHPAETGQYIFAISSDENSEFWLSEDESPKNINLLAYIGKTGSEWTAPGEYDKFSSQTSKPVQLLKNHQYFFDVLYKQNEGMDHIEVAWRRNKDDSSFEVITAEYLSLYMDESSLKVVETDLIPQTAASQKPTPESTPDLDEVREDPRDVIYKLPLLQDWFLHKVFPECDYKPIYIFDNATIERYDGIYHVRYSSVYPNDYTRLVREDTQGQLCFYMKDDVYNTEEGGGFDPYLKIEEKAHEIKEETKAGEDPAAESDLQNAKKPKWEQVFNVKPVEFHSKQGDFCVRTCNRAGNIIMVRKEVRHVVEAFTKQLQSVKNSDLVLKRVLNVEKKANLTVGSRYLIELEMENSQGQSVLISKYVFTSGKEKPGVLPSLCSPKDVTWNRKTMVHIILPVKNQGRWVRHFIQEMENIYQATGDKNFNIIIVDFSSDDIDVLKELKNANLPSYNFKKIQGNFARTLGIQVGVDMVKDDDSIVFMVDLHIHFPPSIIDSVRKHCIQGKMVFAPVVMRLDCGATLEDPKGFWETQGYGLVGIYKSDMNRIGGMNIEEFTYNWGGEDWELLDRIVLNKLEVERLNLRNFAHFFHSKRGMWNTV